MITTEAYRSLKARARELFYARVPRGRAGSVAQESSQEVAMAIINYRGLKELVTTSGFSVLTTSAVLIVPSAAPRVTINTTSFVKTSKSPLVGD